MPDKISSLLDAADYIGVLSLYGIAIAFGGLGGFCGSSVALLKMGGFSKLKQGIAVVLGLTIAGAFCSLMVFTGILSYEVLAGKHVIENIEIVFHMSVFTGFFTSIAMMVANKGISHISLKYGAASINVKMNRRERDS
ncbi:MAG: hypothetical protein KAQ89_07320 [Planctomycetes bacterium]|nr:hypothetical protein [Planctomycetota bacterium]